MKTNHGNSPQKNSKTEVRSKEEEIKNDSFGIPLSKIPGRKEFNEKRQRDIENKKNGYKRPRINDKRKASPLEIVKKLFKKKK